MDILDNDRDLMSALGHKQTYAAQTGMSALPPDSDRESGLPQPVMSALHPKADMCSAARDVCFGPKADMTLSNWDVRFTPKRAVRRRAVTSLSHRRPALELT